MTSPRFYHPGNIASSVRLEPQAAHHALRVLRLNSGDPVILFNGEGGEYRGLISHCHKDGVNVAIGEFLSIERESPLRIVLAQGISSGENMDFTVQKAVELGVSGIQPIETTRSVVRLSGERAEKRAAHWRRVAISACEQCGRNRLPDIGAIATLDEWLARLDGGMRWLLSPAAQRSLRDFARPDTIVWLLAGPEGGLTAEEEEAARAAAFQPVRLGPRVLRTETAAVAALSAMQALWGD